jgi:hypothetical protein
MSVALAGPAPGPRHAGRDVTVEEHGVPTVVETSRAASITRRGNPWIFAQRSVRSWAVVRTPWKR